MQTIIIVKIFVFYDTVLKCNNSIENKTKENENKTKERKRNERKQNEL